MALVIQSTLKLPFLWRFFFKHFFVQPFPNAFPNKKRDLSPHIYLPPQKKNRKHTTSLLLMEEIRNNHLGWC